MRVGLKTGKPFYLPSETVEETVSLFCDQPVLARCLELRFYRKAGVSTGNSIEDGSTKNSRIDFNRLFSRTEGSSNGGFRNNSRVCMEDENGEFKSMLSRENNYSGFCVKICKICENFDLKNGANIFPFSFQLKSDEQGTGRAKNYSAGGSIELESLLCVEAVCKVARCDGSIGCATTLTGNAEQDLTARLLGLELNRKMSTRERETTGKKEGASGTVRPLSLKETLGNPHEHSFGNLEEIGYKKEEEEITSDAFLISIVGKTVKNSYVDTKIRRSSLFCLFSKSLNYRIETGRDWYTRGDMVTVLCRPLAAQCPPKNTNYLKRILSVKRPAITSVAASLYQSILYSRPPSDSIGTKGGAIERDSAETQLVASYNAAQTGKSTFTLRFRTPVSLGPTLSSDFFSVQCFLILHVGLSNGRTVKIKKPLDIGEVKYPLGMDESEGVGDRHFYVMRHLDY